MLCRARAGDEVAFAELYDVVAPRLYGLVRRIVVDPTASEDVTCEVFLEIWRTAARFDEARVSALGWMVGIAHRTAVERARSAETHGMRGRPDPSPAPRPDGPRAGEPSEAAHRVGQAFAALPLDQRGALDLAYFGGHTHGEVGTIMGLPTGTAPAMLRDGLGDLGRNLGHRA